MNRYQKNLLQSGEGKDHPLVIAFYYLAWAVLAVWVLNW